MIDVNIKVDNINNALKTLLSVPEALEEVSRTVAERLKLLVKARTPVGTRSGSRTTKTKAGRHVRGLAKRSWSDITYSGGGYSFENATPYILALDRGSDPGKEPWPNATNVRTVSSKGKIFSSRVVDSKGSGIVDPILSDARVIDSIARTVVKYIKQEMSKYA